MPEEDEWGGRKVSLQDFPRGNEGAVNLKPHLCMEIESPMAPGKAFPGERWALWILWEWLMGQGSRDLNNDRTGRR